MHYDWPGNIRELKNAIESVMILAEGNRIAAKHLPIRISEGGRCLCRWKRGAATAMILFRREECRSTTLRRNLIRQAIDQARGNKTTAARLLHITRDTLRYKVKKYKLE